MVIKQITQRTKCLCVICKRVLYYKILTLNSEGLFLLQRIPSLSFKLELVAVTCDEGSAEAFLGDVANLLDAFHLLNLVVVGNRNGEERSS